MHFESEEDAAATSTLFRKLIQSYHVSAQERQLVESFADNNRESNVAGISTETIQQNKRAQLLGREITRLMMYKHQIRKTYRGRIYYDDADNSDVLLRELLERQQSMRPDDVNPEDVCSDRSHMDLLEVKCPLLCSKTSVYRTTLAKRLLENEIEAKMVFVEIELLRMIEDDELTADEASMILSKILMDRDNVNQRLLSFLGESEKPKPQQPSSSSSSKGVEQPTAAAPAPAAVTPTPPMRTAAEYSDITFEEYCALKNKVRRNVGRSSN